MAGILAAGRRNQIVSLGTLVFRVIYVASTLQ